MSTNDGRDWFAPRNDQRREEERRPDEERPPPPPSPTPPAGLRAPYDQPTPGEETVPFSQIVLPPGGQGVPPGGPGVPPGQAPPSEQGTPPQRGGRHSHAAPPQSAGNPPGLGPTHGHNMPPAQGGTPYGHNPSPAQGGAPYAQAPPPAQGGAPYAQNPPPAQGGAPYGQNPPPAQGGAPYGQDAPYGPDVARARGGAPMGPRDVPRQPRPVRRRGMPAAPDGMSPARPRHLHPDQQVWPPAGREPVGGSTQPIPAVPAPAPAPAVAGPQGSPTPEGRQSPPPVPQEPQPPAPAQPAPRRRRRTLLVAVGAVLVSLLATGAEMYDGYVFKEKVTAKETKETTVAAGGAGKVYDIEFKASVATTQAPKDSSHGPEVTWLKVVISKKVLDAAYATMTAAPYDVKLDDRAGRTWTVVMEQYGSLPTDKLEVGKEYKIEGMAIVPTPVANEVELSFRPSSYRSDTPTEDLFKRDTVTKEPDDRVLRFKRR